MDWDEWSTWDEIYVLDTETTGLSGHPKDLVLDIGIVRVVPKDRIVEPVFSSVVGYDTDVWPDELRESWIFSNSDLTLRMVGDAPPISEVCREVRAILRGKKVTSYNMEFDFNKYLRHPPWSVKPPWVTMAPDIMKAANSVREIPRAKVSPDGWQSYPKLEAAYGYLCTDDPAGISGGQDHRALSDAVAASHLMLRLIDMDIYHY